MLVDAEDILELKIAVTMFADAGSTWMVVICVFHKRHIIGMHEAQYWDCLVPECLNITSHCMYVYWIYSDVFW